MFVDDIDLYCWKEPLKMGEELFGKIQEEMSCADYCVTWRAMMVDLDHIQSLSDGISDGSMVTILALQAAHPDNSDLLALKRHAALKHAPKVTWKSLVLPYEGGGSDRLHVWERRYRSTVNSNKALPLSRMAYDSF